MKILALSDRVLGHIYSSNVDKQYPDVDLLVGCGDLPFYYLEFLISALNTPLVYVRGNHDAGPQYTVDGRTLTAVEGGTDLHAQIVNVGGITMAGFEGSMRYRPNAPLMYSENEMRWEVMRILPQMLWRQLRHGRSVDIFVTHSPPYGVHDRSDLAHRGFRIFRTLIRYFKPRYFLHGHIHVYRQDAQRETQVNETTVINVYPYRLLEIDTTEWHLGVTE